MNNLKEVHRMPRRVYVLPALLISIGALVGCSTEPSGSENNPAKNASDSNTPRVGPNGSVEVDDLRWRLDHATSTSTIGEEGGLGAKANGVFVIVDLSVTNKKSESVTLTDEAVSLTAGKAVYKPDSSADVALSGQPGKVLLIESLGPNVTLHGKIGFDVNPAVLHENPELRFNELGFGTTHGYIALPSL